MHREALELLRDKIAQFQLELEKLRIQVRREDEELNPSDRRRFPLRRIKDRIPELVDALGELRRDLAELMGKPESV